MKLIPFNQPYSDARCLEYVQAALASRHGSGDGPFTRRCHQMLEETLGVRRVLLTTSCTSALEMAALLLDVKPGDEVIIPSFTFVSTANAFALRGARIRFADVRPDTLNLDERSLSSLITPRTRAILPVHYAGIACNMDEITRLAERHGIAIVEDNAHGLFAKFRGRWLGTVGRLATQSFHDTKNFSMGEGGALLINDATLAERAEIIREKGTDRSRFFRGQVDKYTWVDLGSSYLPSDTLAALLLAQLQAREAIQSRRRAIWNAYNDQLCDWARPRGVQLPTVPDGCEPSYHLYYMLMPSLEERTRFIDHLRASGVQAVFHYLPLHLSRMGQMHGGQPGQCPVAERVSDTLVRLPLFAGLTDEQLNTVIRAVRAFS